MQAPFVRPACCRRLRVRSRAQGPRPEGSCRQQNLPVQGRARMQQLVPVWNRPPAGSPWPLPRLGMCTSARLLATARVHARHSAMPLLWRHAPTVDLSGVTFICLSVSRGRSLLSATQEAHLLCRMGARTASCGHRPPQAPCSGASQDTRPSGRMLCERTWQQIQVLPQQLWWFRTPPAAQLG